MLSWQGATSIPDLGYYRELGTAGETSVQVQLSTHLSSLNYIALNLAHLPGFFVIAWAWCWALCAGREPKRAGRLALAISVAFSIGNELSQFAVPYRIASPLDVMLNLMGAALAVMLHGKLAAALIR